MKKRLMTAALAMIMAVSLIGCRAGGKAATQAKKSGTADGMMIGLSMNTQTNPFFVSVQQGVKDAASKSGHSGKGRREPDRYETGGNHCRYL